MSITTFSTMNKLLQAQLCKYFDEAGQVPENFSEFYARRGKHLSFYIAFRTGNAAPGAGRYL